MLLIIDTCILHKVFNSDDPNFPEYKSVHKCITMCKGVMIYGGETFKREYKDFLSVKRNKSRKLIIELTKKTKIKELPKDKVDALEAKLYLIENKDKNKFNDAHLIACSIIGNCRLICTDDSRADKYLKDKKFYPNSTMRPSIYRNINHQHLLSECW